MNVIIVGCGNIGIKRLKAIAKIKEIDIKAIVEINQAQITLLKQTYKIPVFKDYKKFLLDESINAFIISAPTHSALQIIEDALNAHKHVLCEKPLGDKITQTDFITNLANSKKLVLHIGFNIRYDEGLQKAKSLIDKGEIGKPYFFKCTYVNGSVLTNENRVGALLDMGIHNIYLSKFFMGEALPISSAMQRFEYEIKDRDDNGFALLKTDEMIGFIHFSLVRWKNDFKLEVSGSKGSVVVEGLTKWGYQKTTLFKRKYPSGYPNETFFEFKGNDETWKKECIDFAQRIKNNDLEKNNEALQSMEIAEIIKEKSLTQ